MVLYVLLLVQYDYRYMFRHLSPVYYSGICISFYYLIIMQVYAGYILSLFSCENILNEVNKWLFELDFLEF